MLSHAGGHWFESSSLRHENPLEPQGSEGFPFFRGRTSHMAYKKISHKGIRQGAGKAYYLGSSQFRYASEVFHDTYGGSELCSGKWRNGTIAEP